MWRWMDAVTAARVGRRVVGSANTREEKRFTDNKRQTETWRLLLARTESYLVKPLRHSLYLRFFFLDLRMPEPLDTTTAAGLSDSALRAARAAASSLRASFSVPIPAP